MIDPNSLDLPSLWTHLSSGGLVRRLLELARDEDLGDRGDVTARAMGSASRRTRASLRAREPGVAAGLAVIPTLLDVFGAPIEGSPGVRDGQRFEKGDTLATLTGDLAQVVAVERTLLNLVGRLCGVATLTRRYVDAVAGTKAAILDTRKTTPGLRVLEKYAVRCGGGHSHRLGLHDGVLVKDNHIAGVPLDELTSTLTRAAEAAKGAGDLLFFEVEVDSLDQFSRVLAVPPGLIDIALLDNMASATMREAARLRDATNPALLLEASGGVRLDTVRAIAETGVDRISVGALTHGATSLDLGLDID